ncbi:hypothetical protein IW261DRAFT_1423293 [Armillaria novae-zelandiae]|uniref:Uncharacterized protein n=1 Tax=Armillaria novae-zelandiae TaxID=153914 RepID=A0AA39NY03_9AGAR|nr:hypothetical protein IW261DRAFT_1423293 [Armillaria novae-zelandiae]
MEPWVSQVLASEWESNYWANKQQAHPRKAFSNESNPYAARTIKSSCYLGPHLPIVQGEAKSQWVLGHMFCNEWVHESIQSHCLAFVGTVDSNRPFWATDAINNPNSSKVTPGVVPESPVGPRTMQKGMVKTIVNDGRQMIQNRDVMGPYVGRKINFKSTFLSCWWTLIGKSLHNPPGVQNEMEAKYSTTECSHMPINFVLATFSFLLRMQSLSMTRMLHWLSQEIWGIEEYLARLFFHHRA